MFASLLLTTLLTGRSLAADFKVTSPDLVEGKTIDTAQVYNGFGCTGGNRSPALSWTGAPAGTQSFAVLVHDPDAPTGGAGWWHWLVHDIPASATGLPAGAGDGSTLPAGAVQAVTDFGVAGWGGPCPPVGDKPHRYLLTVYALKVAKLDLPAGARASLIGFVVNANTLAKAEIMALYGR